MLNIIHTDFHALRVFLVDARVYGATNEFLSSWSQNHHGCAVHSSAHTNHSQNLKIDMDHIWDAFDEVLSPNSRFVQKKSHLHSMKHKRTKNGKHYEYEVGANFVG